MIHPGHHARFALMLLLALVAGSAAGIIASVLLERSLANYAATFFLKPTPSTSNGDVRRETPSTYDEAVAQIRDIAAASVVVITPATIDSRLPASWMSEHDALGYGVVVSADGWMVTTADVLADIANPLRQTEVWVEGERYTPTQIVNDTLTDFVLVKVAANGLSPVAFGASRDTANGTPVFLAEGTHALRATTLVKSRAGGLAVLPAENSAYQWELGDNAVVSTPVFAASGDLLALTTADGAALPLHMGEAFANDVLRSGSVTHAGFGAYVIDVSLPLNIDATLRQGRDDGALVSTLLTDGPAAIAGVRAGDIIVAVDDVRVDARMSFADVLRTYDPGEQATLTIARDGAEQQVALTFVDANDLLY